MATNIIKTQIQFRRDTAANWELYKDIIPATGEPCFVIDKNILKIGDGHTTFEKLNPINGTNFEIAVDGKSIILEDDTLKLMGFESAEIGAYPVKTADGIKWEIPSDEVVNKLQEDLESLQTNVDSLSETLLDKIDGLEAKVNGSGEGSIDAKIDARINDFAAKISDDGTVNTLKELVDYVSDHGGEVETIVNDITNLQDLVGKESVADQIKNSNYFVRGIKANGTLLEMIDGIVNIPVSDATLPVKGSDEIDVAEDGTLSIKKINVNKIIQDDNSVFILDGGGAV